MQESGCLGNAAKQSLRWSEALSYNDQRIRFLTEEQIPTLVAACRNEHGQPWLAPLVTLALHTGMRQGELRNLRWTDINFDTGVITIKQGKTERIKSISINSAAREALAWFADNRYGDYLLMWPWRKRVGKVTVHNAFGRANIGSGYN